MKFENLLWARNELIGCFLIKLTIASVYNGIDIPSAQSG